MPPKESRIAKASSLWSSTAPHGAAVFALLLGMLMIVAGLVGSDPVEANRISISIQPPTNLAASPTSITAQTLLEPHQRIVEAEVRRGDTLSIIFARAGLPTSTLQQVLDADRKAHSLQDLYPGQKLRFLMDADGALAEFQHTKTPLETNIYRRNGDAFSAQTEVRQPEVRRAFRHAVVKRSMYEAGQDAGLSGRMILELANVLGGVVDFALDPRVGDTFSVLYEEKYLDGERIAEGAIIAAEYVNEGRHHTAYRFTDSQGQTGYFSEDGVSMRKMFLRAPLDFTRVSSNFNMRRMHPIARVIRPHRGVDYSAPTGTPVYASGDGRVTESGYSRANGNYVFIAHDGRIATRYLHLHKRLVKAGQRVSQGQTIGTVGATGLATGPHLHYEFLVDGAHRNPRTELDKLPRARALDKREMARFTPEVSGLQTMLAKYGTAWERAVASADQN